MHKLTKTQIKEKMNKNTNLQAHPRIGEELEERSFRFARDVGRFCRKIKKDLVLIEYCSQGIRSSSSVGANYIEANESFSRTDFIHRAKICRKEAKESHYWLRLIRELILGQDDIAECDRLIQEARELTLIFNSMVNKKR